jgi:hypothetical protein
MSKKCAYCGKENVSFTKEHIYPKCIYERTPEQNLLFVPNINKVIEAEATIKDVCSDCNNGELSKLDAYFCGLFDLYIKNFIHRNDIVIFNYEFDTLTRWLLKVSYNSARSSKTNHEYLSQFTDYILYNISRPDGLALFVQLIIPYKLTKDQLETFPRKNELINGEALPTFTRAGQIEQPRGSGFRPGRFFAINSYQFYIFIRPDNMSEKAWKKYISNINSLVPGAIQLRRFKNKIKLTASSVTALDSNLELIKQNESAYNEWKSKNRET